MCFRKVTSICYAGKLATIMEDVVVKQSQIISVQDTLLKRIEGMTRPFKSGSTCTVSDWQKFTFQSQGSLKIPLLKQETFVNVYQKIYTSEAKCLTFANSQQKYSFAGALSHLDLTKEKKIMHPITMHLLTQSLALQASSYDLELADQVGYYSDKYCMYGFADKAACFDFDYDPTDSKAVRDHPNNHRPSTENVSKAFYSPVVLLGAIEEKALNSKLDSPAFAQLASQMAGFVEAARVVKGFNFNSFPGLLIGVEESDGRRQLVGHCVLWTQENGQEFRQVSKLLRSQKEFCSGIDWWLQQCEALRKAAKEVYQKRQGRRHVLVSSPDAPGTGSDQGEEDADDHSSVDEASTLLQSTSLGSAPSRRACNPELSEHIVKVFGIGDNCRRTENWVAAYCARVQASKS